MNELEKYLITTSKYKHIIYGQLQKWPRILTLLDCKICNSLIELYPMDKKEIRDLINEQTQSYQITKIDESGNGVESIGGSPDPHDKKQTIAPAENTFKGALIRFLLDKGYEGELAHNESVVISNKQVKKTAKKYNSTFSFNSSIVLRRRKPDFYFVIEGLAIEIDGESHNRNQEKIRTDGTRDIDYLSLGVRVYPITSGDIYDPKWLRYHLESIYQELIRLRSEPTFGSKYNNRKRRISGLRDKYSKIHNVKLKYNRAARKFTHPSGDYECENQFEGYRIKFKSKKGKTV